MRSTALSISEVRRDPTIVVSAQKIASRFNSSNSTYRQQMSRQWRDLFSAKQRYCFRRGRRHLPLFHRKHPPFLCDSIMKIFYHFIEKNSIFALIPRRCIAPYNLLRHPNAVYRCADNSTGIAGPLATGIQSLECRRLKVFFPQDSYRRRRPGFHPG